MNTLLNIRMGPVSARNCPRLILSDFRSLYSRIHQISLSNLNGYRNCSNISKPPFTGENMATPYCSSPCCSIGRKMAQQATNPDLNESDKSLKQSPIDIITCRTVYQEDLNVRPLSISYSPSIFKVTNNGYSVKFSFNKSNDPLKMPSIKGGPINGSQIYKLLEFHFHWSDSNEYGSEHMINAESFSSELHMVHWNSSMYPNFSTALSEPEGLTVFAVFLKAANTQVSTTSSVVGADATSPIYKQLEMYVKKSIEMNKNIETELIDPTKLLPNNQHSYFTYKGSLTTSPFTENVTWVVFNDPVYIKSDFLRSCRQLSSIPGTDSPKSPSECIQTNFRSIMPMNKRTIYRSFY